MNYVLHLLIYLDIFVLVALSLNLVVGYCGLLTLAHAGYYAIGAYAYALLSVTLGWGFLPALICGAGIAALLSLAVSLPATRLRGDFFVLASLAVQAFIFSGLYNWSSSTAPLGSWRNLTNGPFGITNIPRPSIGPWHPSTSLEMAVLATIVAVACSAILWRLKTSPWARLLVSMREDELATRALGKNTRLAKIQAFAISGAMVAIAGALYVSYVRYIDPSSASLDESILMLSMVIVGGSGGFLGPVMGAGILVGLPEAMRFLSLPEAQAANLRLAIYGASLILLMHLRPQGVAGRYRVD